MDKKQTFRSRIKNALQRLSHKKLYPPDQPYISQPEQGHINPNSEIGDNYRETEIDIQSITGTSIKFGKQRQIEIDSQGCPKELTNQPNFIIGTGRRVSNIEDIGGVCRFCQAQATQAFQEGKLTLEEAQLHSLFDIKSGFQCDICGVYTCSVHCRPIQTPQGIADACISCQEEIKRQERRKKIIRFLLSPFTNNEESEKL